MNILTTIKNIFTKTPPSSTVTYDAEAYLIKHTKDIQEETKLFIEKYGNDFNTFFYRKDVDIFIRKEILPTRKHNYEYNGALNNSHWNTKHLFNFPGAFYTGESGNCGTGDSEAPNNVMYDENAMEFIFKQPQTFEELLSVIDAAEVEVYDSYSCDGNNFWTYAKCKEWWKNRFDIIFEMNKTETRKTNGSRASLFEDYLKNNAESDLKKYCYFLENGIYPETATTILPQLD